MFFTLLLRFMVGWLLPAFFLVACVPLSEEKQEETEAVPLTEEEQLRQIYEGFNPEPRDFVEEDQEAQGLKWYPDQTQAPLKEVDDTEGFEDIQNEQNGVEGAKKQPRFLLSIYPQVDTKSIELFYTVSDNRLDEWKLFYQVDDLSLERVSLTVDYQDLALFGFDYYKMPGLLKFVATFEEGNEDTAYELYIDPARQQKDVHFKADRLKGIIAKGVFGSKALLLKNSSGLPFVVSVIYTDTRDNQEKTMMIALTANVDRLVYLPEFMNLKQVSVSVEAYGYNQVYSAENLFKGNALEACLKTDFQGGRPVSLQVTGVELSSCFDGEKAFDDFLMALMPEIAMFKEKVFNPELPGD